MKDKLDYDELDYSCTASGWGRLKVTAAVGPKLTGCVSDKLGKDGVK